jgi:hypothetical protein
MTHCRLAAGAQVNDQLFATVALSRRCCLVIAGVVLVRTADLVMNGANPVVEPHRNQRVGHPGSVLQGDGPAQVPADLGWSPVSSPHSSQAAFHVSRASARSSAASSSPSASVTPLLENQVATL